MSFSDVSVKLNGQIFDRAWVNDLRTAGVALETGVKEVNTMTIADNQSSAAAITSCTIDGATYTAGKIIGSLRRTDDTPTDKMCIVELYLYYQSATWVLEQETHGDDLGVTFSVTTAAGVGTVKYASDDYPGASYTGTLKWQWDFKLETA